MRQSISLKSLLVNDGILILLYLGRAFPCLSFSLITLHLPSHSNNLLYIQLGREFSPDLGPANQRDLQISCSQTRYHNIRLFHQRPFAWSDPIHSTDSGIAFTWPKSWQPFQMGSGRLALGLLVAWGTQVVGQWKSVQNIP